MMISKHTNNLEEPSTLKTRFPHTHLFLLTKYMALHSIWAHSSHSQTWKRELSYIQNDIQKGTIAAQHKSW